MSAWGSPEWVISMWLNNDQGAQEWANGIMRDSSSERWDTRGDDLRDAFDESWVVPVESGFARGIFRDLINHADWSEIAEGTWVDE